jgi:glycosidase
MMNVSSTHDAPRLLSCFGNPGKYKFDASPAADKDYISGMPSDETYQRVRLYLVHLFTSVGAPQIWNGEEMGMWGGDDPDPRKPLWWSDKSFEPETATNYQPGPKTYDKVHFNQQQYGWYKNLIAIRKANPVLMHGDIEFFLTAGQRLGYKRVSGDDVVVVMFNLESTSCTFKIPASGSYTNLITGEKIEGNEVIIKAMEAVILKKN